MRVSVGDTYPASNHRFPKLSLHRGDQALEVPLHDVVMRAGLDARDRGILADHT